MYTADTNSLTLSTSLPTTTPPSTALLAFLSPAGASLATLSPTEYTTLLTIASIPTGSSPLTSFHSTIHSLYTPYLLASPSEALPPAIETILTDLDKTLSTHTATSGGLGDGGPSSPNNFSQILSPLAEINFWQDFNGRAVSKSTLSEITGALRPVVDLFTALSAKDGAANGGDENSNPNSSSSSSPLPLLSLISSFAEGSPLESALLTLYATNNDADPDSLPYPPFRMTHVLSLLLTSLTRYVRNHYLLSTSYLLTLPYPTLKTILTQSLTLLSTATTTFQKLTQYDFTENDNPYPSPPFTHPPTTAYTTRLHSLLAIRTTHVELLSILTPTAGAQLTSSTPFSPLSTYGDVTLVTPYTQARYDAAVRDYEQGLAGVEGGVGRDVKEKVQGVTEPVRQLGVLFRYVEGPGNHWTESERVDRERTPASPFLLPPTFDLHAPPFVHTRVWLTHICGAGTRICSAGRGSGRAWRASWGRFGVGWAT